MLAKFFAGVTGRLILIAIVLAVPIFGFSQWREARNSRQQTRLSESQAEAVSSSAVDAIGEAGALHSRDTRSDQLTRENSNAIRNAPGADAPVDNSVRAAGLDSLCRRPAYRGSEFCLQRPAASRVAGAGGGSPAP